MSSLLITSLAIAALIAGYIFYSKKVKQWVGLDENEEMGAPTKVAPFEGTTASRGSINPYH